jgi:hypothetical protein
VSVNFVFIQIHTMKTIVYFIKKPDLVRFFFLFVFW